MTQNVILVVRMLPVELRAGVKPPLDHQVTY